MLAKRGVALPTNNMSTHTMKVTTFSSTSDERWNISSPEVFTYFLLPPVDDTGAFKDGIEMPFGFYDIYVFKHLAQSDAL